ncbi:MAG TPA: alpha-mannosidase, partial [Acidobacteriaceae bacterium]
MTKSVLVGAALFSLCLTCYAQVPTPPDDAMAKVMAALSPQARTTVERLRTLNTIAADQWRYHAGDLAHGEAVTLDDSSWPVVSPKSKAPGEAAWYRHSIEVPRTLHGYDPTGMRLWLRFRASAGDSVTEIIYVNGSRVAMGEALEPVLLTESAKPGDRILVAVKLLQSSSEKTFESASVRADYASGRPNPFDLSTEVLSAEALIPTLSQQPDADRAVLEKAVALVDMQALAGAATPSAQQQFDRSLTAAEEQMRTLRPMLQQATFHLTGNSHIDAAWLWPQSETVDVVKRTFSTAAQLLNEYPRYTYTQSAAQYNDWIADKYPSIENQIKQQIKR